MLSMIESMLDGSIIYVVMQRGEALYLEMKIALQWPSQEKPETNSVKECVCLLGHSFARELGLGFRVRVTPQLTPHPCSCSLSAPLFGKHSLGHVCVGPAGRVKRGSC